MPGACKRPLLYGEGHSVVVASRLHGYCPRAPIGMVSDDEVCRDRVVIHQTKAVHGHPITSYVQGPNAAQARTGKRHWNRSATRSERRRDGGQGWRRRLESGTGEIDWRPEHTKAT